MLNPKERNLLLHLNLKLVLKKKKKQKKISNLEKKLKQNGEFKDKMSQGEVAPVRQQELASEVSVMEELDNLHLTD